MRTQHKNSAKFLSPTAKFILESPEKGYLKRDSSGKLIETPADMFKRVADKIASGDLLFNSTLEEAGKSSKNFYSIMSRMDFLPTSYILRHAGRELSTFFACMVMPLEDDLGKIYETLRDQAVVQRGGMGVGYDFSRLRPEGDIIHSTGKEASGPISFMKLFDFSSEVIQNRGSFKHAAHMGVLKISHPDIYKFINVKKNNNQLTNFNISVAITDEFMDAYKNNTDFSLINPRNGAVTEKVSAKKLFHDLATAGWECAEPGIIFIDEINRKNQTPGLGKIDAVNLCGEEPLHHYETCTLGSINLHNCINTATKKVDYKKIEELCTSAVYFLDNAISLSWYIDERSRKINEANRRLGIGVVGFADLLLELDIRYGSNESIKMAEDVMSYINQKTFEASSKLAKKRGNFANYDKSIYKDGKITMRNCARTAIAPTGHLSLIADVNGGIEPYFSFVYERKNMQTMGNKTIIITNKILEQRLKHAGIDVAKVLKEVLKTGSLQHIQGVPQAVKDVFVATHDIKPADHVKLQAAFQKHTDNAITKTINFPSTATVNDVEQTYLLAYELKCKGITIYRDKSRDQQVLNLSN